MATPRLMQRRDLFLESPVIGELSDAEYEALKERLFDAYTYGELSDEDRTLLQRGVMAVAAQGIPHLGVGPSGDLAAIDAGIDASDDGDGDEALEEALDSVGPGLYGYGPAPLADSLDGDATDDAEDVQDGPVDDDGFPLVEDELPSADDEGWVGL